LQANDVIVSEGKDIVELQIGFVGQLYGNVVLKEKFIFFELKIYLFFRKILFEIELFILKFIYFKINLYLKIVL